MKGRMPTPAAAPPTSVTEAPPTLDGGDNQFRASQLPAAEEEASPLDEGPAAPIAVPEELLEASQGADSSITEDAAGAITTGIDANAQWTMTADIQLEPKREADGWHLDVVRFHTPFHWHLNAGAHWNTIDQFPGGSYTPSFNMAEGSRRHELAEIRGVQALWHDLEDEHRTFSGSAYATREALDAAYTAWSTRLVPPHRAAVRAISTHANPLGPNAEWSYYQQEYAAHQPRRTAQAPPSGGTGPAADRTATPSAGRPR